MRIVSVVTIAVAALLFGCHTTAPSTSDVPLLGMTKKQVVARLGFPTLARMLPTSARGGPGFEIWTYYQSSASGEIELKDVVFGNSMSNLGRVVSEGVNIVPSQIISAETPEGLRAIIDYNAKHGM